MSLTGSSRTVLNRTYTRTVELGAAQVTYAISESLTWVDGDVINGSQLVYSLDDEAIAGSGGSATSLDLVAALLDPLTGTAQTWTKVRELYIKNNTTTVGSTLEVKGNFITTVLLTGTTPNLILGPGGILHVRNPSAAGYAVTATTGDVISLQGYTAAAVNIDIFIAGSGSVA